MSASFPYWHGISPPDYYFITKLGKKYWINGRNTISPWCAFCYKLSLEHFPSQLSVSQHAFLDQLPPAGSSASLTIGYCVHQQNYSLDLHLPMLENWSQKSRVSSERAAVTKFAQVSADSPASGCSSALLHCLSLSKLNYLSTVKHLPYCIQWISCIFLTCIFSTWFD